MNAPLRLTPDRSYWQPLGLHAAADMGARVEPAQRMSHDGHARPSLDYEVWHMRGETMLVRIIDGMPHALDVCGQPDGAIKVPTWIEPRGSFVAAHVERRAVPPSDWAHEQYLRELAAERRADARDEARDYRRRTWREKSFQIE